MEVAHRGHILAREGQQAGAAAVADGQFPAFGRFHAVGGAEHFQVRNGAHRGQVFDRLVGGAVFAHADGIMRHHEDDANAHQGGQADGGAAIVGEDKEGAAIRDHAAMQRHAVHGGAHAMLADAVMDVAAIEVARLDLHQPLGAGVVGRRQVGRAADGGEEFAVDDLQRLLAHLAGAGGGLFR